MNQFEQAILGSLISEPKGLVEIGNLTAEDFSDKNHKKIFSTIQEMFRKGEPIDVMNVVKNLEDKGDLEGEEAVLYIAEIKKLPNNNVAYYAEKITDASLKRKLKVAGEKIVELADSVKPVQEVLNEASKVLLSSAKTKEMESADIKSGIHDFLDLQAANIQKYEDGGILGMSTGYKWLDNSIDGIRPGHFWVIGGYTSTGKTFFALNLVKNLIRQKKRVMFISLEMSRTDIVGRLVGIMSNLNSTILLKRPHLMKEEFQTEMNEALQELNDSRMALYTAAHDFHGALLSILQEHTKESLDCVFVDYLQLFNAAGKNEYESMTNISKELQAFAAKTGIPIIALSQISNEGAKNESSVMSFKGSGAIGASADMAIELKTDMEGITPEVLKGKIERHESIPVKMIVKKSRHGVYGGFRCQFSGYFGTFTEEINEKQY